MARTYRFNHGARAINTLFSAMTKAGLGDSYRHVLTVRGRKSGDPRSTPVDVMDVDGALWLVAGYGVVNWVWNVRAARQVTLTRGRRTRSYTAREASADEAIPVLRQYMHAVPVTRAYFDATPDAPDELVRREVENHPVFRLTETEP